MNHRTNVTIVPIFALKFGVIVGNCRIPRMYHSQVQIT